MIIDQCVHLIRISKNLERIAELSTNICEDVSYMFGGKVVKHQQSKNEDLYQISVNHYKEYSGPTKLISVLPKLLNAWKNSRIPITAVTIIKVHIC